MNESAYILQAWLPLIVWQQVDAPQYQKGFITISVISLILIMTAFEIRILEKNEKARSASTLTNLKDLVLTDKCRHRFINDYQSDNSSTNKNTTKIAKVNLQAIEAP